ncbi:hypothetical protein [Acinetobacter pollinis]|uniref:Uncharacterized protein n=1 Tax=Acinetobacter pollinis TaxID=2605270 RepID=A0ABU6DTW7_9GAMM|nr:hypothetical protein [Acinetobacter pollinis]MEB5477275.1 hypothetical protein [Acinetobacter pollinis]
MNKEEYIYEYYKNIVKPTVNEFLLDQTNIRRGQLAAIVLDHVRDYRAVQLNIKNDKGDYSSNKVLEQIKGSCPDAVFIRDVCNASKHAVLTSNNFKTPRTLSNADQVDAEDLPGLFDAPFGESYFAEASYVFIKFDKEQDINGEKTLFRMLHDSINEVIKYWDKELDYEN